MRVQRHPTAAFTQVEGEIFIVTSDNRLHNLRGATALHLWDALADGPRTLAELVASTVERFDVPPAQAAADLEPFVTAAIERGVFELAREPGSP